MEGIGNIHDDMRRHFRTKLKNIFTKFIRKFGQVPPPTHTPSSLVTSVHGHVLCIVLTVFCVSRFELVKSMLPAEHHKVLANIRKAEARTKRRKLALEEQDDSESEVEAPKTKSQRLELLPQRTGPPPSPRALTPRSPLKPPIFCPLVSRTSSQSRTVICQRMKDELAVLIRRPVNRRKDGPGSKKERKMTHLTSWIPKFPREYWVRSCFWKVKKNKPKNNFIPWRNFMRFRCFSATNPSLKKSAKVEHGFKVTSDGRLIIKEDDEEDVKHKGERWSCGCPLVLVDSLSLARLQL